FSWYIFIIYDVYVADGDTCLFFLNVASECVWINNTQLHVLLDPTSTIAPGDAIVFRPFSIRALGGLDYLVCGSFIHYKHVMHRHLFYSRLLLVLVTLYLSLY